MSALAEKTLGTCILLLNFGQAMAQFHEFVAVQKKGFKKSAGSGQKFAVELAAIDESPESVSLSAAAR